AHGRPAGPKGCDSTVDRVWDRVRRDGSKLPQAHRARAAGGLADDNIPDSRGSGERKAHRRRLARRQTRIGEKTRRIDSLEYSHRSVDRLETSTHGPEGNADC